MKFSLSQLAFLFLFLLFGGFRDPDKQNFAMPLELLKNECYLLDTMHIDTLYLNSFYLNKNNKKLKPFLYVSSSIPECKLSFNDLMNSKNMSLFFENSRMSDILLPILIRSLDSIEHNDPSLESKFFYQELNNGNSLFGIKNKLENLRENSSPMLINGSYYLFLVKGSLLNYHSTEINININEYYSNVYFQVICPI